VREQERIMLKDGYVTARQAATLAGVEHVGTIHRWAREGKIEYQRGGPGKNAPWYIKTASLLAHFKSGEHPVDAIVKRIEKFIAESAREVAQATKEQAC
jgi:hypothetical protein